MLKTKIQAEDISDIIFKVAYICGNILDLFEIRIYKLINFF